MHILYSTYNYLIYTLKRQYLSRSNSSIITCTYINENYLSTSNSNCNNNKLMNKLTM